MYPEVYSVEGESVRKNGQCMLHSDQLADQVERTAPCLQCVQLFLLSGTSRPSCFDVLPEGLSPGLASVVYCPPPLSSCAPLPLCTVPPPRWRGSSVSLCSTEAYCMSQRAKLRGRDSRTCPGLGDCGLALDMTDDQGRRKCWSRRMAAAPGPMDTQASEIPTRCPASETSFLSTCPDHAQERLDGLDQDDGAR